MTPKEKADELVNKFYNAAMNFSSTVRVRHELSKQCALIAVDEILSIQVVKDGFWQQVKTEIENL